jgi:hypothetical protein
MKPMNDKPEILDPKRIRAELEIHGKLNVIVGLKSTALELAFENGKRRIAGIIQESLFGGILDQEATEDDAFHSVMAEGHMDLWKPFFEVISDEEIKDWLRDPEQAMPAIEAKIEGLRHSLERLKRVLGVAGRKDGN